MTTLLTMRTRIATELSKHALTATQINDAIRSAVKHYEREAFWFNQKVGTFSTVANQELYTSSALADIPDMIRIDAMLVSSGSNKLRLRGVDSRSIDDVQDGTVTGEPEMYSRYADKIRLYPIPSAVYTITVSYIYKLATLAADADTNAWTDECEEMIRQASKRIIAADVLQDDEIAKRCAALEQVAYNRIRSENRNRQPQPELRANWPFNRQYFDAARGY